MVDTFKVCPECGKPLVNTKLEAHALTHYPAYLDPAKSGKLAIKRQALILSGGVTPEAYKKDHEEV